MNIVIAIYSAGAMGSALSRRLREHGARVLTSLSGRSAATVERARAAGMEDVPLQTITTADLLLSIVPPGEAVALAGELVTYLSESSHQPVYIDCNALSPNTKTQVALMLAETGCDVVDGAIIGGPAPTGRERSQNLRQWRAKQPRIHPSHPRS